MTKGIVAAIFALLLIGFVFLVVNIKNAYKVIPVAASNKLEVPSFADWREFTAQSGRFKVMLPAVPQYAKEAVDIPNTDKKRRYEMYISEEMDGSLYMISLITYPPEVDTSNTDQMLHDIVNEMMATNAGNQLKQLTNSMYQNHRAVNFHIINRDFDVLGKAFMLQKTLYLLTYISKKDYSSEPEFEHFINSFELLSPEKAGKTPEKTSQKLGISFL